MVNDLVRTEILFGELLCWTGSTEKLSFHENSVTDFEVRRRDPVSICGTLVIVRATCKLRGDETLKERDSL